MGVNDSLCLSALSDLCQLCPGVVRQIDAVQSHVHGQHMEELI